jgi:hypothetical protein
MTCLKKVKAGHIHYLDDVENYDMQSICSKTWDRKRLLSLAKRVARVNLDSTAKVSGAMQFSCA